MEKKQSYANDKFIKDFAQSLANCQCLLNGIVVNHDWMANSGDINVIRQAMDAKTAGIALMMFNAFDVFMDSFIMYDSHIGTKDPNKFFEVCEWVNRLRVNMGMQKRVFK